MHLIDVRDVYKIYNPGENQVNALDGVSLTIDEGEFVAIIGLLRQVHLDEYAGSIGCTHQRGVLHQRQPGRGSDRRPDERDPQ